MLKILNRNKERWDPDTPITAEDGPMDRGDSLRAVAALYNDGRLFVSKSHVNNPAVLSLISEARMEGHDDIDIHPVDVAEVAECYKSTGAYSTQVRQNDTRMRREVLDLVAQVANRGASDIHIVVGEESTDIRARIDGSMQHIGEWPAEYGHSFCAAAFTMADASDVNYQPYEYQGARVSNRKDLKLPEGVTSLRLQFNPITFGGRALIVRILRSTDEQTAGDLAGLGFSPEHLEDFELLRSKPFGINVVAGPTGHGKSTTLQRNVTSILQEHDYRMAFYTVEDPPEYIIPGAVQMPVTNASSREERDEAFTKAIAAALRSNPDRIMIGEIRDGASANLAFEAAMTGHQVWTTLHSNDAVTIPFRLRDLGVDNFKLTDPTLVTGLISQRLVKIVCQNCARRVVDPDDLDINLLTRLDNCEIELESIKLQNPKGCDVCGEGNGYGGRTGVSEIIVPDETFMELVREDRKTDAQKYWLTQLGGRSMVEHTTDKIKDGLIDPRDAETVMGPLHIPERGEVD